MWMIFPNPLRIAKKMTSGINILFENLGKKIINPNYDYKNLKKENIILKESNNNNNDGKNGKNNNNGNNKKGCC